MRQLRPPVFFARNVTDARRFYRDLAAAADGALKIVTGGVESCGADYLVNRGSFPFTTIEYVARGHGDLDMAGRHHDLGPGCVFVYQKGVSHRIAARSLMVKYFVAFTGSNAARLVKSSGIGAGELVRVSPADSLAPLFEELVWAGLRADPTSEDYCRKILECLAVRIRATIVNTAEREPAGLRKYQLCRDAIEADFLLLHGVRDIANRCQISDAYLCHLFKRYDHQTPYRMLTRLKMNYAAALIQQSDLKVKEVGEAVGYQDQFHFSRVFREFLGVPPSAWRQMNAKPGGTKPA